MERDGGGPSDDGARSSRTGFDGIADGMAEARAGPTCPWRPASEDGRSGDREGRRATGQGVLATKRNLAEGLMALYEATSRALVNHRTPLADAIPSGS